MMLVHNLIDMPVSILRIITTRIPIVYTLHQLIRTPVKSVITIRLLERKFKEKAHNDNYCNATCCAVFLCCVKLWLCQRCSCTNYSLFRRSEACVVRVPLLHVLVKPDHITLSVLQIGVGGRQPTARAPTTTLTGPQHLGARRSFISVPTVGNKFQFW